MADTIAAMAETNDDIVAVKMEMICGAIVMESDGVQNNNISVLRNLDGCGSGIRIVRISNTL